MDIDKAFAHVRKIAESTGLPGFEISTSYGTPSLKVAGKFLARMKDAETLVVRCPLDEKAMLMEAAPDLFYETDHYRGYDALLVRLPAADNATIAARLTRAWEMQAPARLRKTANIPSPSGN
ncbi:MAG TPA: MmcQ/YjbR family DNA-binding protein [Acetobacteraceae bacterium]|nr:MmcQ/YjbR family DNA-binding protein [Acetobacteraceae bacterium]